MYAIRAGTAFDGEQQLAGGALVVFDGQVSRQCSRRVRAHRMAVMFWTC